MAASASAARASTRKANGHARKPADQGQVVEDAGKPGIGDKIKSGADDAWAATKAGLKSPEAQMMYLSFGQGLALGAGLTLGYYAVDAIVS